ncbi:ROK family transcriptional regulator [Ruania zhangjianzhongii]|uniref:ROK family transcriptional regulator n=1 Tax=Ruania zhangjianzhongii TaxID=2603206 RepID=UPI0011CB94E5|nr:ROK family transcriptional regulator [Ruania zhangjianzhongii]
MPDLPVAVNLRFMREVNTAAVLTSLRELDPVSVGGLAESTGLSRQAVARVLDELQNDGLAEVLPPDRTERASGRPAQQVRFRAEAGYVVGALIDPQVIHLAVADLRGSVVATSRAPLEATPQDQHVLDLLVGETRALLDGAGISVADVWSATVGAPGIIDTETGVISVVPSMPVLTGDVLVAALGSYLSCPVYLDNDLKLATRGELWKGIGVGARHLVVVHWGERVGAGIVIDGVLYRGASNDAGDLGFLDILAGDVDPVPGLGRFESWVGVRALIHLAADELETAGEGDRARAVREAGEAAFDTVLDGILQQDRPLLAAIARLAGRFAHGLVALRTILDPELVILSGPLARAGRPLLAALHQSLTEQPLTPPTLRLSTLGRDAVVHGALRHSLDQVEAGGYVHTERRPSAFSAGVPASPVLAD